MTVLPQTRRTVAGIINSVETLEGAGFLVRRPFPKSSFSQFDPFRLLDELGPVNLKPGQAKGAPAHPHRGFETVTYILDGRLEHKDSEGHTGVLNPGDVQWMTAGAGVVHSEMPSSEFTRTGGRLHGIQLWVNLPQRDKMIAPHYQEIGAAQIPVAQTEVTLSKRLKTTKPEGWDELMVNTLQQRIHQHQLLSNLRIKLLHLHKMLLNTERVTYEQVRGTVSRGELLQLVINHEQFAWLHQLTQLIVGIDDLLHADEPVTKETLGTLMDDVRALLTPDEWGNDFAIKYDAALQRNPDVVLAHAEVVMLLASGTQ